MSKALDLKGFDLIEHFHSKSGVLYGSGPTAPELYRSPDRDDPYVKDLKRILCRHHPHLTDAPPILVKKVRYIAGPIPMVATRAATSRQIGNRGIVVNSVRPYSAKKRSSCYWHDAGWEKRGDYLIGHYAVGRKRFAGSIELLDSVVVPAKYYIYNPPDAVLTGPHAACFRKKGEVAGKEKYWIHFSEEPSDIDCGIIQIQRDLATSVSG